MDEIIARNMLNLLKLLIILLLLHLVGCLYYCIDDAPSHKHQIHEEPDSLFRNSANTPKHRADISVPGGRHLT